MTGLEHLRGQLAVISGAGSGIGAGLARFAATRLGMTVVVGDRDLERAEQVAGELRSNNAVATAVRMDVGDWDSVRPAATSVLATHGVPAFLACNAGIEHTGLAWETTAANWERVLRVNVFGAFHLMRAFVPAMVNRGLPGQILFTSSVGGISISADQSAYLVSKHAVRVLGQTLQADLRSVGSQLAVSILLPGAVRTRIMQDALSAGDERADAFRRMLAGHLADEGISPDQVAEVTFAGIDDGLTWIYPHPELARESLQVHTTELLRSVDARPEPGEGAVCGG